MNTNNVVSQVAAADLSGKEHRLVKLTSTGIDIAASTDRIIGTLMRAAPHQEAGGNAPIGKAVDVFLVKSHFVAYVTLGATSAAIALGDGLVPDPANPGKVIPGSSNPIALAWQALAAGADGTIINALFLS
jgi:hypothetical protein